MLTEHQINEAARQWLSLTPEQREEIRRQNLKVQALIERYRPLPAAPETAGERG